MKEEIIEVMSKLQKKAIRYKSQKRLQMTFNDDEYYSYILFEYIRDLQSQLKAKEEIIKKASEYNQEIVDDYLGKYDCEYCDGRYATATHNLEILSKGENK